MQYGVGAERAGASGLRRDGRKQAMGNREESAKMKTYASIVKMPSEKLVEHAMYENRQGTPNERHTQRVTELDSAATKLRRLRC